MPDKQYTHLPHIDITDPAQTITQILNALQAQLEDLRGGAWLSDDATAFYEQMSEVELPRLHRIQQLYAELAEQQEQLEEIKAQMSNGDKS